MKKRFLFTATSILIILAMVVSLLASCGKPIENTPDINDSDDFLTDNKNESSSTYSLGIYTISEILKLINNNADSLFVALVEVEIKSLIPNDDDEYEKFKYNEYATMNDYSFYNAQVNDIMYKDENINFEKDIIFSCDNFTTFNESDKFICILVNFDPLSDNPNLDNVYGALNGENTIFEIKESNGEKYIIRKYDLVTENEYGLDLAISEKQQLAERLDENCIISKSERFGNESDYYDKENGDEKSEYKYAAKYDLFVPRLLEDIIAVKNNEYISDNRILESTSNNEEIVSNISNEEIESINERN